MGRWSSRLFVGVGLCVSVWLVTIFFLEGGLKVFGEVTGPVVGVLAPIVGEVWRARHQAADPRSVDASADLLAQAVRAQWRKAATERVLLVPAPIPVGWSLSDLPVGPVEAAVGDPDEAPAFPPLPGQHRVTKEDLRVGGGRGELFAVYAGLASGRVVVDGAPGAGKTGSAVLLVLDALEHRDHVDAKDRPRVPVPVLLTAHSWDPVICPVQDWLAAQLAATYPLFRHRSGQAEAAALVAAGAVALILDGLDEMDVARRPAALQALSVAPLRVVVLTRSQEMTQAAGVAWLVGAVAVHLHDITGSEGADYLQRGRTGPEPAGWTQLLAHLRSNPDSAFACGLSTPLALTLIRDTYRPDDDVSDLLDATRCSTAEDIKQYLIARVIPAAYTPRPGRSNPPYSEAQARQALAFLAQQMNQDHTRDLGWWQIPRWTPTRPRILISILAGMLLGGLVGALLGALNFVLGDVLAGGLQTGFAQAFGIRQDIWTELWKGLLGGLTFGLGVGLPLGLSFGRSSREPNRVRTWRAISLRSILTAGLKYGLVFLLAFGLLFYLLFGFLEMVVFGFAFGLSGGSLRQLLAGPLGLLLSLVSGLTLGLMAGFLLVRRLDLLGWHSEGEGSPQGPGKSRHTNRMIGLGFGIASWIGIAGLGFAFSPDATGIVLGIVFGLIFGLIFGLMVWLAVWLMVWLVGLVPQLAGGFVARLAVESAEDEGGPLGPLQSWRNDRVFGLVTGLALGLASGLTFGFAGGVLAWIARRIMAGLVPGLALPGFESGPGSWFALELASSLAYGLAVGLVYGITSSMTWSTTLAWRLLQRSRRVPAVGLIPFLGDARDRGVLRTVGAVYQFRHATLQDHLARQTTSSPGNWREAHA